jgi:hypothetical protein
VLHSLGGDRESLFGVFLWFRNRNGKKREKSEKKEPWLMVFVKSIPALERKWRVLTCASNLGLYGPYPRGKISKVKILATYLNKIRYFQQSNQKKKKRRKSGEKKQVILKAFRTCVVVVSK